VSAPAGVLVQASSAKVVRMLVGNPEGTKVAMMLGIFGHDAPSANSLLAHANSTGSSETASTEADGTATEDSNHDLPKTDVSSQPWL